MNHAGLSVAYVIPDFAKEYSFLFAFFSLLTQIQFVLFCYL